LPPSLFFFFFFLKRMFFFPAPLCFLKFGDMVYSFEKNEKNFCLVFLLASIQIAGTPGALLFCIPTSPHHTVSTCSFNHPLCRIILFLTTQMWSHHLSITNKTSFWCPTFETFDRASGASKKQLTYVSRVCKGFYFIFPSKQVCPSNLPQILDSVQGVNCILGAVANKTSPMDGEPEGLTIHEREPSFPKPFGFSYPPPCHTPNQQQKTPWRNFLSVFGGGALIVHFVLLGVVFCLDFSPFFLLLLFPLSGTFPLFILPYTKRCKWNSLLQIILCIQGGYYPSLLPFPLSPIEGNSHILLTTSHP
jgi:hypothetical protein